MKTPNSLTDKTDITSFFVSKWSAWKNAESPSQRTDKTDITGHEGSFVSFVSDSPGHFQKFTCVSEKENSSSVCPHLRVYRRPDNTLVCSVCVMVKRPGPQTWEAQTFPQCAEHDPYPPQPQDGLLRQCRKCPYVYVWREELTL